MDVPPPYDSALKPVRWIGSSRDDLRECPEAVRNVVGGAGVLEVVEDFDGNAFRAVYTVRFARAVYVLHVFQKKSKRGIATPARDIALIRERLRRAEEDYKQWRKENPV